jgi:hypothetical protein
MLNDYNQLVKGITTSPWLITQDGLATIVEVVNMRLEGKAFSDEEIRIRLEAVDAKRDGERKTHAPKLRVALVLFRYTVASSPSLI